MNKVLSVLVSVALACGILMADVESDRTAIRKAGDQALEAARARDIPRWVSFYADDATLFPPSESVVQGKEAIHEWLSRFVDSPHFAVHWKTAEVEVSEAGDLGYASGTYEATLSDDEGKPLTEQGKWVAVYRKQADGAWKCVTDIWNTNGM